MQYAWDPAKDALNQRKHGLSLADGIPALEDPDRDSFIDDRFDYGEERIITLGMTHHGVLCVVSTEWDEDIIRIISDRKGEPDEVERYGLSKT
jgi:uncharacterized DUF497 family protein